METTKSSECPANYEIIYTVNIAMAIPKELPVFDSPETVEKHSKQYLSTKEVEAQHVQKCYTVEYSLIPDYPNPIRVRLVVTGMSVKLYLENETQILTAWQEGDQMWLAWSYPVKIMVTKDLAIKMASHRITIRLWSIEGVVFPKPKPKKYKGIRQPEERNEKDPGRADDTKTIVQSLRGMFGKENTKCSSQGDRECIVPSVRKPSKLHLLSFPASGVEDLLSEWIKLSSAAKASIQMLYGAPGKDRGSSMSDHSQSGKKGKGRHRDTQKGTASATRITKNELASVELSPVHLFAGRKSITDYLVIRAPGITEGICNISLDKAFLSDELRAELNPLVITILSATSLPNSPVPFHILEEKCAPVYCQYKFHNLNVHRTKGQRHSTNVLFRDASLVLTGLLSPGELQEYLQGPPLEIEVHDRDRNLIGGPVEIGGISHRYSLQYNVPHNPHGVARVDLSDLLLGLRSFKAIVPIMCSHNTRTSEAIEHGFPYIAGGSQVDTMPMGDYLDFGSQLKVQFNIANPLTKKQNGPTSDCPFGRIIFIFRCACETAPAWLQSEILTINAAALRLKFHSEDDIKRDLSHHKMKAREGIKNIITGFYLCDQQIHLFVLEGLRNKAIQALLETAQVKFSNSVQQQMNVIYNSEMSFSKRLYKELDVSLAPIYLKEPLECIMRQPQVYVRGMLSHACFQALSRLSHLLHTKKMKDAIYSDLLPSAEMVLSMKQEFGAISWMVEEEGSLASNHHELHKSLESLRTRRKTHKPLDNYNPEYVAWKQLASQEHSMDIKNYIQNNIDEVHHASEMLQKVKPAVLVATPAVGKQAHNYSIQTENSTAQAWELLHNEMAKQPKRRFTYSQDYHSATVVPVDVEKERKASEAMSMAAWRTPDGFIYPGFKSSMEANEHPRHPDEARVEELGKTWRENVLHGSKLKPPLTRDTLWLWSKRHQDFERYLNPSNLFDPDAPLTINLAGESLRQEQLESARAQDRWLKKVVVNRDSSKPGCIPEFKCHMAQGKAGKLEGLLKDKPMKYSLRNPKMALKPIPAVSVIPHSEVTYPEDAEHNVFVPGPLSEHSLCFNNNFLPRYTSDSNKFCFQKSCSFLYKRAAPPLTAEERPAFLFSRPATVPKRPPNNVRTPVARKVVQTRTHKDLFVHIA